MDGVVSLGGGACCNDLSWNFLDQNGLIIYIKEDVDTLFGRLRTNKGERPLISDLNDDDLRVFIKEKMAERSKYYDRAHFIFEKDKTSIDFLVGHIRSYLDQE